LGTANPLTVTPTSTTTYTVTGTIASCTSTANITVTVNPNPTVSISASANPICAGTSTTLTANGTSSYLWSGSLGTANPLTVTPISTTTYTVIGTIAGCIGTANITVTVNPLPTALITGDTLICTGTSTLLTATGGTDYLWSTAAITPSITVIPSNGATYSVTVSDAGCSSTVSINIFLLALPSANAGHDTTINLTDGSVQLTGSGGVSFLWYPTTGLSCTDCANPIASPLSTTTYFLIVTDTNGCTDTATVIVFVVDVDCGEVFVPNAFSPNNEGKNELECVYGNCIKSMEFSVYDRWGEKVFTSTDAKVCWDGTYNGKKLNTGVFVYYLKATLYNGSEINKKGNINLFR
jgi:gliding motility-associated-like protein